MSVKTVRGARTVKTRGVQIVIIKPLPRGSFIARARDLGLVLFPQSVIPVSRRDLVQHPIRIGDWLLVNLIETGQDKCDLKNGVFRWKVEKFIQRNPLNGVKIDRGKNGNSLVLFKVSDEQQGAGGYIMYLGKIVGTSTTVLRI